MNDDYVVPFESKNQLNQFDQKPEIKVVGVGGGGGNAVNHMYNQGIQDVSFAVCNTDAKALSISPVKERVLLGDEGLGAGNNPEVGREKANESIDRIRKMLGDGCKMVFITAGMGGGTGTGAAPIVAKVAKEMGILTVGIVTIPFRWEGIVKIDKALDGVEEISKNVDALLVINNERLRSVYSDLSLENAFAKADDTVSVAAKGISEIITTKGRISLDFNDVRTILKDGGVAIMSTGYGEGEGRVKAAIEDALNSPLLNNNDIFKSKKFLLSINAGTDSPLMVDEISEVDEFMLNFKKDLQTKWGWCVDPSLGHKVKITILASGFGLRNLEEMEEHFQKKDQKDLAALAKREQEEMEREKRRTQYYGDDLPYGVRKKNYQNYYIMTMDDLDNDDVISMLDSTPVYQRTKTAVNQIREKSVTVDATVPSEEGGATTSIITF